MAAEGESLGLSHPDDELAQSAGGSSGIPVVGLGGSAGSLGSFEVFFAAVPADSGARPSSSSNTWLPPTRVCCRKSWPSTRA